MSAKKNDRRNDEVNAEIIFKIRNIFFLIILYILSLGLFRSYWYFSVANTINNAGKRIKIHKGLIISILLINLLGISAFILSFVFSKDQDSVSFFENLLIGLGNLSFIIRFYVSLRIKNFIEEYYFYEKKFEFEISSPMIFFFNTLYLQYQFNKVVIFSDDQGILMKQGKRKIKTNKKQ